jgi:D-glycero-alpha-D-manno-heptose-7-phosphate kinase
MVIAQTPFRISFFGGGTDYPNWFLENGGAVLATSIDKYIYTSVRVLPPFHDHKYRIIYSKMENVRKIEEIVHPAVREVFKYMNIEEGLELHHDSDLPARAGMGSSSSFVVGLLHALHALRGEIVDREKLALQSTYVEQQLLHENVGCQDQVMAAFGGFNVVNFRVGGGFSVKPLTLKESRISDLQNHLMLFYTGVDRIASVVAAEQIKNTARNKTELVAMHQMVHDGLEILNSSAPITDFGRLLHEGWQLKRKLSSKITNSTIDEIYAAGIESGAVGGKLLGAGSGGFMLFFVPPEKQKQVIMRLKNLLHVKFSFDRGGSNIIFYRREAA